MSTKLYGDQITNLRSGTLNQSNERGAVQRQYFEYTVPAATIAVADILFIGFVPKGARILGGVWKNTAGGAAATGKIGKYTYAATPVLVDDDWFGNVTDMTGITAQTFADTAAYHFGEEATTDYYIGVLTAAQAVQAAAVIQGWIDILL